MKNIYFIAAVLVMSAASFGQAKGNIEFGFGGGYSYSTISSTDFYGTPDTNQSFNIGVSADYYFSDRWSIKAKAIYDRKGWDNSGIIVDGDMLVNTDFNLDYITVPVMANWHFGRTRNWYLNFGPYIGFLMSAEETEFNTDLKDDFNSVDAGIAFGIGVKIPVSDKLKIYIEYDGQGGLSEIFADNEDDRITNTRGAINVGLNFLL